jgi:hypothetical protein
MGSPALRPTEAVGGPSHVLICIEWKGRLEPSCGSEMNVALLVVIAHLHLAAIWLFDRANCQKLPHPLSRCRKSRRSMFWTPDTLCMTPNSQTAHPLPWPGHCSLQSSEHSFSRRRHRPNERSVNRHTPPFSQVGELSMLFIALLMARLIGSYKV